MRNVGLDILRFLAVALVLVRHMRLSADAPGVLHVWKTGGWVGVDVFFVLSGFLISTLLFREYQRTGKLDVKRFLIRRGFKIYPAFWALLGSTLVVALLFKNAIPPQGLAGEVLFLQNYLGGLWPHTWSLAVEEHFYLVVAGIFAFWTARSPEHQFRSVPMLFVLIAAVCLALRIAVTVLLPEYSNRTHLFGSHLRFDSLFFGVLLAYLVMFQRLDERLSRVPTFVLLALGAVLLAPAFYYPVEEHEWVHVVGVMVFYLGSGCLLLAAIRTGSSSSRLLQGIGALGAASYSIYLWHMPVNDWGWLFVRKLSGIEHPALYAVVYLTGSCVLGLFMNRLLETPVMRLRNHWFPSPPMQAGPQINACPAVPSGDSAGGFRSEPGSDASPDPLPARLPLS